MFLELLLFVIDGFAIVVVVVIAVHARVVAFDGDDAPGTLVGCTLGDATS